jgi:4-diphosphocytidyl-2-C-methyl-D-erythritol kinase
VRPVEAVRERAPAKVNLLLHVLAREASGYHALETLLCAVDLADEVEVRRGAPGIRLAVDGSVDTGAPERNLCVLAAEAYHDAIGREGAVDISLTKRIPARAGLGGGSSDAAATLRALNALDGRPLPPSSLLDLAVALGADVPFFLCGSPLALAWGRGERLLALPPLPARPVLLAHPEATVSTPDAFRRLGEARGADAPPRARSFPLAALGGWASVAALAENDFEEGVLPTLPGAAGALEAMAAEGAVLARMTGTGSTLFGVFEDDAPRERARERVNALGLRCVLARTLA